VILLRNIKNVFSIPDLKKKLLFTLGVLLVYRFGFHIPVVGVDTTALAELVKQATGLGNLLSYFDTFTGGALTGCTVFALGIGPYITASIMTQILGFTIPYFEQLLKEGEYGRKIINQYTRYLALGISVLQGTLFAIALEARGIALTPGIAFKLLFVLSLSVGCMIVMWLGEQISLFGVGNGSSVIIFAGIVSHFPGYIIRTYEYARSGIFYQGNLPGVNAFAGIAIWVVLMIIAMCIIFLEKGERKIPVQYARRVVGNKMYGGQSSFIPFKINSAGVMPVIFAGSVLQMPKMIFGMLADKFAIFGTLSAMLIDTGLFHNILQFTFIVGFYFFYTALVFNPTELADNIKKAGGFIPGIRPGKKTADFFDNILTRLGLVGSVYLGFLALLPNIMMAVVGYNRMPFVLGGTSLLIVVGAALEIANQMESYLIEHNYEGFLSTGRIKSRGAR
jgi:preprotein translocase subunit SecY